MTIQHPSALGTSQPSSYLLDEHVKAEIKRTRIKIANETRFVARLMSNKKLVCDSLMVDSCLQSPEMWVSQKMYHLFMFLLFMESDGEGHGFWKRMMAMGNALNDEAAQAAKLEGFNGNLD
jgi:hypothetical protein